MDAVATRTGPTVRINDDPSRTKREDRRRSSAYSPGSLRSENGHAAKDRPKPTNKLGCLFNPAPEQARLALAQEEIGERAYIIMSWIFRQKRDAGYAPGWVCTKENIQREFGGRRGWSLRSIQRSLVELRAAGLIGYVSDPDDGAGFRIVFPFLGDHSASANQRQEGAAKDVSPPGEPKTSPPPTPGESDLAPPGSQTCLPPRLLDTRTRDETGIGDRNNVNVGSDKGEGTTSQATHGDGASALRIFTPTPSAEPSTASPLHQVVDPAATAPTTATKVVASGMEDPSPATVGDFDLATLNAEELAGFVEELEDLEEEALEARIRLFEARLVRPVDSVTRRLLNAKRVGYVRELDARKRRDVRDEVRPRAAVAIRCVESRPAAATPPPAPSAVDIGAMVGRMCAHRDPKPPAQQVEDIDVMIRRLRPDSSFEVEHCGEIARAIAERLDDQGSVAHWRNVCRDIKAGVLPLRILEEGLKKSRNESVRRRAAVVTAYIKKYKQYKQIA